MIISKLYGGLGNQLFQYATGKSLAHHHNTKHAIDISFIYLNTYRPYLLHDFNINSPTHAKGVPSPTMRRISAGLARRNTTVANIYDSLFMNIRGYNLYEQPKGYPAFFDSTLFQKNEPLYLAGYFQNEKYFSQERESLLKEFTLKNKSHSASLLETQILKTPVSVAVHIRRGDYTNHDSFMILSQQYYKNACKHIEYKHKNISYFVFSDDINDAKKIMHASTNNNEIFFCDSNEFSPSESLWAMSHCTHVIIANSTFSWWGAWLNKNDNAIILAPNVWSTTIQATDILPDHWTIINPYSK